MRKGSPVTPLAFIALALLLVIGAIACQRPDAPAAAAPPDYVATATIKDLMQSLVDPSADAVWLSVTTVQTTTGTIETVPKTDEDWARVRHGALALAEASNLLQMPGRHVARPGEKSETPGVELEPAEMEVLIDKDRAAWNMRARGLREAAVAAVQATDARDAQKVFEVGERIEHACESCHAQYWYPNEKIPQSPPPPPRSE